ncbi:MAG: SH3 domain-containing protein, partial [Stellaceae bacterium]
VICAVALGGCSDMSNPLSLGTGYAVASDDACAPERQSLKSFQDYFFSSMVEGAVGGGLVGGLAGYLAGKDTKSTLIGAGAGAFAGGIGGYYLAKQKANSDPVAVTDSVYQDVSHENQQIDAVSLAFTNLRNCRLRSAEAVKSDYAAGRIGKDAAAAKLQQIRQRFVEDTNFAQSLGSKMAERGSEYQSASDQILQLNPGARQQAAQSEAVATGPQLVANVNARVHETPSESGPQVALLRPGEAVNSVSGANAPADWTQIRLPDGRVGFVASRLVRSAGSPAPARAAPPPESAVGVAELTQSNQLKRKALSDQIADAQTDANGSAFQLSGGISRSGPHADRQAAA